MIQGLRASGLVAGYRAQEPVLTGVDFQVLPGQRIGLIGRSGSGKSTLLKVLLAQLKPSEGEVCFDGQPIAPGSVASLRPYRRQVQYIPQDPASSLDPRLNVQRLIAEPLEQLKVPGDHRERSLKALEQVDLGEEFLTRRRHELSGGQAQRVAIARALATGATYLLADEPVSGLDLSLRMEVLRTLEELENVAIVLVTHDLNAAAYLCEQGVVLHQGQVAESGPMSGLMKKPIHAETRRLVEAIPSLHGYSGNIQNEKREKK